MTNAHDVTREFERLLCRYTGAPYAVALDNCSNAIFLALYYEYWVRGQIASMRIINIPARTYPAVPCEVIHAGGTVVFTPVKGDKLKGPYQLKPTKVWDCALRFTHNMYDPGTHQCLSFTGPYKHLKLGKGGAILTDDIKAYKWFKKARFSGRDECSYHDDDFDKNPVIGWNFYMPVETAARGLHMMPQFYDGNGFAKQNPDLELPYPDLSKFKLWSS